MSHVGFLSVKTLSLGLQRSGKPMFSEEREREREERGRSSE